MEVYEAYWMHTGTNKELLVKGLYQLAFSLPFIFAGPSLYFSLGIRDWNDGRYLWTLVSIVLMLLAGFLFVRGIRMSMRAFFGRKP